MDLFGVGNGLFSMDCCLLNQLEEKFAAANLMRKMKAASKRKIRWPQIGTTDTSVVQQKNMYSIYHLGHA